MGVPSLLNSTVYVYATVVSKSITDSADGAYLDSRLSVRLRLDFGNRQVVHVLGQRISLRVW
jgi:hypothetical protein